MPRFLGWWSVGVALLAGCGQVPPGASTARGAEAPASTDRQRLLESLDSGGGVGIWGLAERVAEQEGEKAIPWLIGVIDADNDYNTVYGIGHFTLRPLTGVEYSQFHDGAWWRRWWEANKSRFPADVQAEPISTPEKTKHGRRYTPFPADCDTLQGKLKLAPEVLNRVGKLDQGWKIDLRGFAQELAKHEDPHAIPYLIGLFRAGKPAIYDVGYYGLRNLTGVEYRDDHDGAWWQAWWRENRAKFPPDVRDIPIPDYTRPLAFDWKELSPQQKEQAAMADVADIPAEDLKVEGNPRMRYFLVGPRKEAAAPKEGFKLVVVMPGGDGGAGFHPFVRRLYKNGMTGDFLVAQPVAVRWTPGQQIVWPTRTNAVKNQGFATEDFVEEVVKDVARRRPIDRRHVYTMSWSSSGPAAYAIALQEATAVTGSYVAMSVFRPASLPPLARAKGRHFLIEHSPQDRVCPYRDAESAVAELKKAGAEVRLVSYEGGHGWRGPIYRRVGENLGWLVEQAGPRGE